MRAFAISGLAAGLIIISLRAQAFQTEIPASPAQATAVELMEAGLATSQNVPKAIYELASGNYQQAKDALNPDDSIRFPWLPGYLDGLLVVSGPLEKSESDHFVMYTPPGQKFLAHYALPSLERSAAYIEKAFGHRPASKIRVEIYPTMEDFSAASTLSVETLERSGAIGICKFHRLMIMSPQTLPLGYRWMDALSHEYLHLTINELSATRAELWLHEGTARHFETAYRLDPPVFLTPDQKTKLLTAAEQGKLIPFSRMSPSLVYLKDQEEVSLAFSQVSYAVGVLTREFGEKKFVGFLSSLRKTDFPAAFRRAFGMTPADFEKHWQEILLKEKWEKTKGTMSDEVRFGEVSEDSVMGADARGRVRLGDRMRMRGLNEAALIEYEKALDEEPDNATILLKAARMNLALGQPDEAVKRLRRATEKNPNYGTPHIELARLVGPEEALSHLMEANAINPFDPAIHELLAAVYEKTGKTADAERERGIEELLKR